MAWSVYERTPSGAIKSYIDPNTSEVISARQYRNRTEAAKSGFKNINQKRKARDYEVENYPKIKHTHHIYDIGLPIDVAKAVQYIIDVSPQFGYGMYIRVETSDGPKQTKIWKKSSSSIQFLINSIIAVVSTYGKNIVITNWYVGLVDYL